jgi:NDP-sugar pyrophosphorylase family protein
MIEHVTNMFDPQDKIVYVCNDQHNLSDLRKVLGDNADIVVMPSHKKGPVYTVKAAFDRIPDRDPVLVSYCDVVVNFDQARFLNHVQDYDGCLITHTGFHPHTLSSTRMAFVRETNGRVLEVKEKASYTDNPQNEHASSGLYWFRSGAMLKHYFNRALAENVTYNDEYYVTLVYNLLIADGLGVGYYDTEQVAILGTPQEIENLEAWRCLAENLHLKNGECAAKCFDYWRTWLTRGVM